ncbi:hypothetical protein [Psychrobacter sp. 1044]|uniref:hypothetical protein n=1 Tax=Psychrobacter sp. 1044 TaxID=2772562 RepID=UPI001918A3F4|nr:hypothetical protein [Psychrobacter sp. 1044]
MKFIKSLLTVTALSLVMAATTTTVAAKEVRYGADRDALGYTFIRFPRNELKEVWETANGPEGILALVNHNEKQAYALVYRHGGKTYTKSIDGVQNDRFNPAADVYIYRSHDKNRDATPAIACKEQVCEFYFPAQSIYAH